MELTTSPHLIEVLGVAGSGKTTLTGHLTDSIHGARRAEFIHTRKPGHLVHFVRSVPGLLPMLLRNLVLRPRVSWREFKLFSYVSQWSSVLQDSARPNELLVLDQGPLYCLGRLQALGSGVTRTEWFAEYRTRMLRAWAGELTAIVVLDARDEVLLERINQRDQWHVAKDQDTRVAAEFVSRYRALFDGLIRQVELESRPMVLRFDTGVMSARQIAATVEEQLAELMARVGSTREEETGS
jgi:deoxyadenosine/deoxycytidine kinase